MSTFRTLTFAAHFTTCAAPLSLEDARRVVTEFVTHYNNKRLHSAIGYITPEDKLEGRADMIHTARDAKLAAAREARKAKRKAS
ncbi:MAG: integrase core domain-containing protein [Sedimentisphaerales bacterium]|nr:integrase core domain-containing protein [Sedimentisphaerales bacterium]